MKVLRGLDTSHDSELKIEFDQLGPGDYTVAAEFFPVHPVGVTLTTFINLGAITSSGIARKSIGHSLHNGNIRANFQASKATNAGTNE